VESRCVIIGTGSVTYNVRYGSDRSAAGAAVTAIPVACSSTTTGVDAAIDSPKIPANSYVWMTTTATSGTPNELHLDLFYTVD